MADFQNGCRVVAALCVLASLLHLSLGDVDLIALGLLVFMVSFINWTAFKRRGR